MKHIRITHDDGITINWQLDPRLQSGAVVLSVASDVAPSTELCAGKQGDPYPYDRVVNLLSPTVSTQAAKIIFADADIRGESVMRSANDAFIRHVDLTSLRVIVWNVAGFPGGQAGLEAFVLQYYPPLPTIEYKVI